MTLLRLEDGSLAAPDAAATREHLAACPRCQALGRELDELRATLASFSATRPGGDCPAPHVLVTYAEGLMAAGERGIFEAHAADCGRCSADLAALGRELAGTDLEVETPAWARERAAAMVPEAAAPAVAERVAVATGFARFVESLRAAAFPLAATAAVAIMILAQLPEPELRTPITRGPAGEAVIAITVPAPGADLPADGLLAWDPVPGAGAYTVTVVDAAGGLVWRGQSPVAWIRVPASAGLASGASYAFWVEAVLESGEKVESSVRHFTR